MLQKQRVVLMGEIIKGLGGNVPLQQRGKGRAMQESAVELDSVGTWGSSLGWVQGNLGHAELEGGDSKPLAMQSFLTALRSPSQGRSDQPFSSCTKGW